MNRLKVSLHGSSAVASVLLVLTCIVIFFCMFIAGVANISKALIPFFATASGIMTALFIVLVLPLSTIRSTRFYMVPISIFISFLFTLTAWMFSLSAIWTYLGWWGILLMFWFRVFASIAVLALIITGQLESALLLTFLVLAKTGLKWYASWLSGLCPVPGVKNRDYDIDAEFTASDDDTPQLKQ